MIELTERQIDAIDRINGMTAGDVQDMPYEFLCELTNYFEDELLIRLIVSRGPTKTWQQSLSNRLKMAHEWWFEEKIDYMMQRAYLEDGHAARFRKCFKAIDYDIASCRLINPPSVALKQTDKSDVLEGEDDESLEDLREQLEQVRNREKGISTGINQAQAALFGLSLANTFGFNYKNKKKELAPMLHKLFGWGESKLAKYLSEGCEKEERDELANIFKDLCPPLYRTIMNRGERPHEATPEATP